MCIRDRICAHLLLLAFHTELKRSSPNIWKTLEGHRVWSIQRKSHIFIVVFASGTSTILLIWVISHLVICLLLLRYHGIGEKFRGEVLGSSFAILIHLLHPVNELMVVIASISALSSSDRLHYRRVHDISLLNVLRLIQTRILIQVDRRIVVNQLIATLPFVEPALVLFAG